MPPVMEHLSFLLLSSPSYDPSRLDGRTRELTAEVGTRIPGVPTQFASLWPTGSAVGLGIPTSWKQRAVCASATRADQRCSFIGRIFIRLRFRLQKINLSKEKGGVGSSKSSAIQFSVGA